MFLLDTNVVSELHKAIRGKGDPLVTAWLAQINLSTCFLSSMTLMELEVGVLRMERRDATQSALLRAWLDQRVVPEFAGRVLAVDEAVARRCARLHVPDPRPERDALIAAGVDGVQRGGRGCRDGAVVRTGIHRAAALRS